MRDTTRLQVVRQGGPERLDVLLEELERDLWDLRLLTFAEAGKVLNRSESTVRRRVDDGAIAAVLEGDEQRIRASELRRYIESLANGGGSH